MKIFYLYINDIIVNSIEKNDIYLSIQFFSYCFYNCRNIYINNYETDLFIFIQDPSKSLSLSLEFDYSRAFDYCSHLYVYLYCSWFWLDK